MPLGNYTSQFFANIYLDGLDQFAKNNLKAKYYIRYVDDIVILNNSRHILERYKGEMQDFLKNLKLELYATKSRIIPVHQGIPFLGFKLFKHYNNLKRKLSTELYMNLVKSQNS